MSLALKCTEIANGIVINVGKYNVRITNETMMINGVVISDYIILGNVIKWENGNIALFSKRIVVRIDDVKFMDGRDTDNVLKNFLYTINSQ